MNDLKYLTIKKLSQIQIRSVLRGEKHFFLLNFCNYANFLSGDFARIDKVVPRTVPVPNCLENPKIFVSKSVWATV